ncbi:MAG TPA: hypothetical protein VMR73_01400 [Candidatus Paceibacterota bacterium]|nr:hypothetical protein [Candidatus Paceibacterota bacterium]
MQVANSIITLIINPAIDVLFGLAILYFVWGVWIYLRQSDSPEGLQTGGRHIMYSLIGIFIMISVGGIMWFIQNSFNLH